MLVFIPILALLVPCAVASNCLQNNKALEAISLDNADLATRVWWDLFGTAEGDFSVFEATRDNLANDWMILGHLPQPNHSPMQKSVEVFRACPEAEANGTADALVEPVGFTLIWDDYATTHIHDGSVWRANCPQGYTRLSDFFYGENGITSPDELFDKVRCVRDDLVEDCEVGIKVWQFQGLSEAVSVWWSSTSGIYLYANQLIDAPPGLSYKCLKESSFIYI